jgi:molecular chaperone GrpE
MEENKDLDAGNSAEQEILSQDETKNIFEEIENSTLDPKDEEISNLKKQVEADKDKYLRLFADFDNFKKRNAKERIELIQTAGKDVIIELLPVLDDFERALKATENATDVHAVRDGMKLIYNKLFHNLGGKGLKAIESKGKEFNVELHEAITEIPAPTADLAGKVVDEIEKGYYLNEKLIRFAKVVVGK